MATVKRMRVDLTGSPVVGASVMTLYMTGTTAAGWPAAVKTWLTGLVASVPSGLNFVVPNSGDELDAATGSLTGVWTAAGGGTVTGTGGGSFVLGTGFRVVWNTAGIVNGRRVRGSTFIVPIASGNFTGSGALDDTFVANQQAAANTLLTSAPPNMVVWSRPTATRLGSAIAITSASVPDKVSWLRSRRS